MRKSLPPPDPPELIKLREAVHFARQRVADSHLEIDAYFDLLDEKFQGVVAEYVHADLDAFNKENLKAYQQLLDARQALDKLEKEITKRKEKSDGKKTQK